MHSPEVILVVGVNGVGKTTTIAKLAHYYKEAGKKVVLAAADTFRAAASEQLTIWAERADVPIVKHQEGADPAAVVYDALASAKARNADIVIIDTAGRLHTKTNLMEELKKIGKNGIVQMDIQLSPGNYSIAFNQDVLGSMLTGSMSLINNMFGK